MCDLPVEQDGGRQRLTAAVQDAALGLKMLGGRLATASDMAVKFPSEAAFSALSRLELEVTENTQHLEQAGDSSSRC
ncbi:hypothetical protein O9992_28475 [Vibrio lentus]|nr:hypothetical protein [Vibrio lentus]